MTTPPTKSPSREFIIIMAMMISMVALSIDIVLPAMGIIAADLKLPDANDVQLVLTVFFVGFATGQVFVGPLADTLGRKPVIVGSFSLFFIGCLLAAWSPSFEVLLLGRLTQGLGISGPRIISNAVVRDLYAGRAMAKVMSIIMMLFILVPMLAPALGQAVIFVLPWRWIFVFLLLIGSTAVTWFALRQPETLAPENRRPFNAKAIFKGIRTVLTNRAALGFTLAMGFIFGPFIGYLGIAQKVFQEVYLVGNLFAVYFSVTASALGVSSIVNARYVERLGMKYICLRGLLSCIALSLLGVVVVFMTNGIPPLWMFMVWLNLVFFSVGLVFGNLNALAMEPLGALAGLGAAVIGALSTLMALPVAWFIGENFDGTVTGFVVGFLIAAAMSLVVFRWASKP